MLNTLRWDLIARPNNQQVFVLSSIQTGLMHYLLLILSTKHIWIRDKLGQTGTLVSHKVDNTEGANLAHKYEMTIKLSLIKIDQKISKEVRHHNLEQIYLKEVLDQIMISVTEMANQQNDLLWKLKLHKIVTGMLLIAMILLIMKTQEKIHNKIQIINGTILIINNNKMSHKIQM